MKFWQIDLSTGVKERISFSVGWHENNERRGRLCPCCGEWYRLPRRLKFDVSMSCHIAKATNIPLIGAVTDDLLLLVSRSFVESISSLGFPYESYFAFVPMNSERTVFLLLMKSKVMEHAKEWIMLQSCPAPCKNLCGVPRSEPWIWEHDLCGLHLAMSSPLALIVSDEVLQALKRNGSTWLKTCKVYGVKVKDQRMPNTVVPTPWRKLYYK